MTCDNIQSAHKPEVIGEDNNAILVYCNECGASERIGKDANGNPQSHIYLEWYLRDFVQPPALLYYKYHPEGMSVV